MAGQNPNADEFVQGFGVLIPKEWTSQLGLMYWNTQYVSTGGQRFWDRLKFGVVITLLVSTAGCIGSRLTPTDAARIISLTREFKATGRLLKVDNLWETGSSIGPWDHCCYSGGFTFELTNPGPNMPVGRLVRADAEFRYWDGKWHLQEVSYGNPPNVVSVWIDNNVAQEQQSKEKNNRKRGQ